MHVRLSLAGALVAALAAPAAAFAQTPPPSFDRPLKPCYVSLTPQQTEPVEIVAKDFTPLAAVQVYADEIAKTTATADAFGKVSGDFAAPFIVSGQRWFTVRLTEPRTPPSPPATLSARTKVTALSVTQSPVQAATGARVRFRGRGFTEKALPVYAHYLFHRQVEHTVLIGKPYGDCGLFSVRRRQFPISHPRTGTWLIQFDQRRDYTPLTSPYTQLKIVVEKKIRPQA